MSRNFELLSQLGEHFTLSQAPPTVQEPAIVASFPTQARRVTASEEEWALVQRVFLAPGEDPPQAVVFCGVEERGPSGALCARVGEILATLGPGDVFLVDADLRSQALHRHYGVSNVPGAASSNGEPGNIKDSAHRIGDGNLWLVSARSWSDAGGAIVSPDCLRSRMAEMRRKSKHVLISAPPVSLYPDAMLFGQVTDGMILVLRANSTRRVTAAKVQKALEASKVRLLGAVLTERTFPIPERLYRKL